MRKTAFVFAAFPLAVILAATAMNLSAQEQRAGKKTTHAMPGMAQDSSHDGFMQHGMSHTRAKGVKLDQKLDEAAHTITLRVGPMRLPAHTSHHAAAQPPDLLWTIPIDGWLTGYTPKMVDPAGAGVPGALLHHTAFWNAGRPDFLCRNKEEHIFGAGSEMNVWPPIPGYGYRVHKGDTIRIETMVYNPTRTDYLSVWLEVAITYAPGAAGGDTGALKSVYPAWIDVKECGNSGYDLDAGKSSQTGIVAVPYDGALLGVGGHLHDYGRQLLLAEAASKKEIARLDTKVDERGRLLSTPIVTFLETGGYALQRGEKLEVTAAYDNPTRKSIEDGAMGIVVGYFLPKNDAEIAALRRARKPTAHSHDH